MNALYEGLAWVALLLGLGCSIFILVEMFRDEVWKGFAGLLCGFYMFWYSIFDFEHEYKWPIVLGSIGGNAVAAGLFRIAGVE